MLHGLQEEELLDLDLPFENDGTEMILGAIFYRISDTWAIFKKAREGFDQEELIYQSLLFCGFNSTGIVESMSWSPNDKKSHRKHFNLVQDMCIAFPMGSVSKFKIGLNWNN